MVANDTKNVPVLPKSRLLFCMAAQNPKKRNRPKKYSKSSLCSNFPHELRIDKIMTTAKNCDLFKIPLTDKIGVISSEPNKATRIEVSTDNTKSNISYTNFFNILCNVYPSFISTYIWCILYNTPNISQAILHYFIILFPNFSP